MDAWIKLFLARWVMCVPESQSSGRNKAGIRKFLGNELSETKLSYIKNETYKKRLHISWWYLRIDWSGNSWDITNILLCVYLHKVAPIHLRPKGIVAKLSSTEHTTAFAKSWSVLRGNSALRVTAFWVVGCFSVHYHTKRKKNIEPKSGRLAVWSILFLLTSVSWAGVGEELKDEDGDEFKDEEASEGGADSRPQFCSHPIIAFWVRHLHHAKRKLWLDLLLN